jgi:homoserine O-succinyltransferase
MPLVAHSKLPAFEALSREGFELVGALTAAASGLPPLRIGLLNLMPDAALQATERQFLRLIDAGGPDVNLYVYPFSLTSEFRGNSAEEYVAEHYSSFESLQEQGLDALIITGANPAMPDVTDEAFWRPLIDVIDWSRNHVESIICSCLATHVVLQHYHQVKRIELPERRWGVYEHQVLVEDHLLLTGVTTPVHAPHSHRYDISRAAMESAGQTVLIAGAEAGVHMAVSDDQFRFVFFQGHPEYDSISLLKEFKREVQKFLSGKRSVYPPFPQDYLDSAAKERLEAYQRQATESDSEFATLPVFPEAEFGDVCFNSWGVAGKTIYRNWLAEVLRRSSAQG